MAAAKAELEKGHYTVALKAAQALPARIEAALGLAPAPAAVAAK